MFRHAFSKLAAIVMHLAMVQDSHAVEKWQTFTAPPPMPVADESGLADINGIRMYYAIYGKGRGSPILLIHGGMGSADVWGFEVLRLSQRHEIIVADSRGHGRSTRTDIPLSYHQMAEDYVALLDKLHEPQVSLVGWSDGGIIGLDIAMNHPEHLSRLFAHAANVTPDGLNNDPDMTVLAAAGARDETEYKRLSSTPGDFEKFRAAIELLWKTEPNYTAADLHRIHVPTEIVVGDHDEFILPEHSRYIAANIPGAKLLILNNVSHLAIYQDPDQYAKSIEDFIDRPF